MGGECWCHTCHKGFKSLGIARHRAMHRDKGEKCKITYSSGDTYTHEWDRNVYPKEGEL